jgi:hypothetical protein
LAAVRHLLLISSYLPEVGQSLSSFGGEEPAPFLEIDPEAGTFTVRLEALAETFLQDCDPEIQRQATGKTARQSLSVLEQPVSQRHGSTCPRRTSSALRTGVHPSTVNASSRIGLAASWNSPPAITPSCRNQRPSAIWC